MKTGVFAEYVKNYFLSVFAFNLRLYSLLNLEYGRLLFSTQNFT